MFSSGKTRLLGLVLLAASSWLALQFMSDNPENQTAPPFSGGIDYYLNGTTIQQFNSSGMPVYRLTAERAEHYQDDDRIELNDVRINYRENKQNQTIGWDLQAGHGILNQAANQTLILDKWVTVTQVNVPNPVTMTTQQMQLNNASKLIRSRHPVTVTQAGNRVTSNTMAVNLQTNAVSLVGNVKAHYAGEARD